VCVLCVCVCACVCVCCVVCVCVCGGCVCVWCVCVCVSGRKHAEELVERRYVSSNLWQDALRVGWVPSLLYGVDM
jgi:hypothetical protein